MIPAALALVVSLGAAGASAAGGSSGTHRWQDYGNARFGYALCYPADLLHAQGEADNGDGRVFSGSGGASLRAWGQYNALEQTLVQAMAQHETRLFRSGARVTYRVRRGGWYVLSGRSGNSIFYAKTLLTGDRFASIELTYPAAGAAAWKPVVERISACLTQAP